MKQGNVSFLMTLAKLRSLRAPYKKPKLEAFCISYAKKAKK